LIVTELPPWAMRRSCSGGVHREPVGVVGEVLEADQLLQVHRGELVLADVGERGGRGEREEGGEGQAGHARRVYHGAAASGITARARPGHPMLTSTRPVLLPTLLLLSSGVACGTGDPAESATASETAPTSATNPTSGTVPTTGGEPSGTPEHRRDRE
jgi:hypothetical protein